MSDGKAYVFCVSDADEHCHPAHRRGCESDQPLTFRRTTRWNLKQVAIQRTRQRVLNLAWSRAMPSELVYALEDGSLHLLRANAGAASVAAPPDGAWPTAEVQSTPQPSPAHLLDC